MAFSDRVTVELYFSSMAFAAILGFVVISRRLRSLKTTGDQLFLALSISDLKVMFRDLDPFGYLENEEMENELVLGIAEEGEESDIPVELSEDESRMLIAEA